MTARQANFELREATASDLARWDEEVRRFANHRVVHTRAWIESLEAAGCGEPLYLLFEKEGDVVGCLPGLLVRLGGFRLYGSPLPGWQTVSMGPAFDPDRLSSAEIVSALVRFLEERHGVSHIELMHSGLDPESMRGLGFEGERVLTYRAELYPGDERRVLDNLKSSARRNIKRARRLGLEVRFEDDERFVDEHYDQLREVFLRGGAVIPYSKQRILDCFRHLHASGNLLAVSVYLPGGRVNIATGTFLIEGSELLLWQWAHRLHYRWYRPTELMTWTVMQRAMAAGCVTFDLMGGGDFKANFGAAPDESKWRWSRSRPRWLAVARNIAATGYRCQQAVRGRTARIAGQAAGNGKRRDEAPALVMGDIDLVQALGLAGIKSTIFAPPGAPARFSRFTRDALDWLDPWDHPSALVDALLRFGESQPEPPVLFYQEDRSLLLVSRHREQLGQFFRFSLPDATLVERLVDKARFQELATELELPVPPALALHPAKDPPPGDLDLEYPLVLKPLMRRPDRWEPIAGHCKAVRIDSAAALRELWPYLAAADVSVVLQTLIPGPETMVESYHTYVNEDGAVAAEFTGRKLRTHPAAFGDSTALTISEAPDVAELGRDIVGRLELRGVAKLDFKRGPDGRLHLLEVNPRFTLWQHLGAKAGVNIPALVYQDLRGRTPPTENHATPGVHWCKIWTDLAASRAQGIPVWRWLTWALGCEVKSAVSWRDPLPIVGAAVSRWLLAGEPANGVKRPDSGNGSHKPDGRAGSVADFELEESKKRVEA